MTNKTNFELSKDELSKVSGSGRGGGPVYRKRGKKKKQKDRDLTEQTATVSVVFPDHALVSLSDENDLKNVAGSGFGGGKFKKDSFKKKEKVFFTTEKSDTGAVIGSDYVSEPLDPIDNNKK